MKAQRLVIIGGVTGGASAAAPARRLSEEAGIIASCQSRRRSWFAARLGSQQGFRVGHLRGSYRTGKTATASTLLETRHNQK